MALRPRTVEGLVTRTSTPVFITGIGPGTSGTGQFVRYLRESGARVIVAPPPLHDWPELRGKWPWRQRRLLQPALAGVRGWRRALQELDTQAATRIVLLHPQTLGFARSLRLVERYRGRVSLYLLDSSFFCVRSYNCVPGELEPCLRCLGGELSAMREHACRPFPIDDPRAAPFVRELRASIARGGTTVLAQKNRHAALAERHFNVTVAVVGLWTQDLEECFGVEPTNSCSDGDQRYDAVYHGHGTDAKGAAWIIDVARGCPGRRFLLPFPNHGQFNAAPDNCHFVAMNWYAGLKAAVADCGIAVAPSMWSAPIESAVIKNFIFAPASAVVVNTSAYADEIPAFLCARLPADPAHAAAELQTRLGQSWRPNAALKCHWLDEFARSNRGCLARIEAATAGTVTNRG